MGRRGCQLGRQNRKYLNFLLIALTFLLLWYAWQVGLFASLFGQIDGVFEGTAKSRTAAKQAFVSKLSTGKEYIYSQVGKYTGLSSPKRSGEPDILGSQANYTNDLGDNNVKRGVEKLSTARTSFNRPKPKQHDTIF